MILKNSLFKSSKIWGVGIAVLGVMACFWVNVFTAGFGADEREHMHAAFMVLSGRVPYLDFFEHHHPLFWYVLQPLVYFCGDSPSVWGYARGVVCLLNGGIVYFLYKICRQAKVSPLAAVLAAAGWFGFYIVQKSGFELRPDLLMILFYLAGLFYYFDYLEDKRYGKLLLSFVLFFCSFLTLQKAVFLLLGQFFLILRAVVKKRILLFDLACALSVVLILSFMLVSMLYQAGMWKVYFQSNWLLNLKIRVMPIVQTKDLYIFMCGAVCCGGVLLCSKNEIMRNVAFLYLFLSVWLLVWQPWYYQYLLPYCALLTLIFGYVVYEPFLRFKLAPVVLLVLVGVFAKQAYDTWRLNLSNAFRLGVYHDVLAFMLQKTEPKDLVLGNGEDMVATMRHSALGYYWFSLGHIASLDKEFFYKQELPDYDLIIKTRKPKAVVNGFWRDCALGEQFIANRDCPFWQKIDRDYLNQHYTDYGFVFIRKD